MSGLIISNISFFLFFFFFFNDTATTEIYTLSLHDALPISERRTALLLDPHLNGSLPAFLGADSGLEAGFMLLQYSAAALASENKGLAHPASVDSIPTSANQEDHVSMGPIAGRQARQVLAHVEQIV